MSWLALLPLVAIAACGRLGFDPSGPTSGDDAASSSDSGSGSGSGDVLAGCLSPGYGDDFNEVIPCNEIGTAMIAGGMLNVSNSQLTITPNPNTTTGLGCVRVSGTFTRPGTFVEISQILPAPGQTMMLLTSSTSTAGFIVTGGTLAYNDSSGATTGQPYNPTANRWWRIRPISTGTIAEVSADGLAWTTFTKSALTLASPVAIAVYVQTDNNDPNPGSAVIQGIDVCP